MLTEAEVKYLAECKARLASGERFASADDYHNCKDDIRSLEAKARGKTASQHDPVGYWYGRQSN